MMVGLEQIEKKVWEEEKLFLMKQVGILLIKNNAIKFGDYILTSGKKSPYYIDLRQTISSPITMDWIANSLTRIVINEIGKEKIDKIPGVPTAGVPFATVVSQKLGIPEIGTSGFGMRWQTTNNHTKPCLNPIAYPQHSPRRPSRPFTAPSKSSAPTCPSC